MNLLYFTGAMMWIFLFVVITITLFLMVMYKNDREELRNRVLSMTSTPVVCEVATAAAADPETTGSLEAQLQTLTEKLAAKELQLRASRTKITQAEQKLYTLQANSSQIHGRYLTVMKDLKSELAKTEAECRNLHDHINILTKRRQELKSEILKQSHCFDESVTSLREKLTFQKEVLSSTPKFKCRYRDTSKRKKNLSKKCACDSNQDQQNSNPVMVETLEYEVTEFPSIENFCDDRADCNRTSKKKTSGLRRKPPICPYKKDGSQRTKTTTSYFTDVGGSKNKPKKFVVTEEIVEFIEPEDGVFEYPASRSSIYQSDTCANVGIYDNPSECYTEDSCQSLGHHSSSRQMYEVSETCIEYDEVEKDKPETICDCCFSEYAKFKSSRNR